MPRTVTTGLYDFDPLMKNSANRVVNEKQVLAVPGRDDFHFLIPQAAPFFVEDVTVRNETTGETYYEGQDFVFGHWFVEGMNKTGRSIAGSIRFLRREIAGIIVLDYHTLGGQWGFDDQAITRELSQRSINPLVRAWAQIDVLPALFPPVAHDQKVDKLIGFQDVVDGLDGIVLAIEAAQTGSTRDHIADRDNPHDVTKAQVGLSFVENYPVASDAEARMGGRTDRYMTPRATREAIEEIGLGALNTHLTDFNNPHNVTKTQVGLGNVQNYQVASVSEANDRTRNDRYMTPARTGQSIERWFQTTIAGYFDGTVQNATGVTPQQIGLGNVENFPIATDTEAVAGTANDRYMTPLRTFQAIDRFAVVPLQTHIDDKFNPHGVTKAQVGLSNVQNYGIATEFQARQGTATNVYMTPALVAEAISTNAGSDLGNHLNDFNNPHNVSKTQVGLSNVQNYAVSDKVQAETGTSNELYMTPLRVKNAIDATVGSNLATHVGNTNNPHNVTAFQVGLGNVENYGIASEQQAKDGDSNLHYMTPLRVKQAIQVLVSGSVDVHTTRTDNPHQVTKAQVGLSNVENYRIASELEARGLSRTDRYLTPAVLSPVLDEFRTNLENYFFNSEDSPLEVNKGQVGLGNVEDYGIATQAEARLGAINTAYMTPLRVKEAIDFQVGTAFASHISDTTNPHNVTKAQVGLSSVENFSVASVSDARGGTLQNRYMTPFHVFEAIDAKLGSRLDGFDTSLSNLSSDLSDKLDITATAADASRVFGKTEAQLMAAVTSSTVNNALNLQGESLSDIFNTVETMTVRNAERFDGRTYSDIQSDILTAVTDGVNNNVTLKHGVMPGSALSSGTTVLFGQHDELQQVTGIMYVRTAAGISTLLMQSFNQSSASLNVMTGVVPDMSIRVRDRDGNVEWYIIANEDIFQIDFIDLGNNGFEVTSQETITEDGPYSVPSGSSTIPLSVSPSTVSLRMDAFDIEFNELESKHNSLESKHDTLQAEFNTLESKHNALQAEFDALEVAFEDAADDLSA